MKFDLTDFLELDTMSLLAVNGGASCSGGSCSSNGGDGNYTPPKETTPSYNIVGNSYAEVANAKPGDKMKKGENNYVTLTQGDIDWAKAQLEKNATNSESTKTDTELNVIIGVGGSCGGACGFTTSVYIAPTDSMRVTGVIGEKTTHQNAHTGIDIGAVEPGKKGDPIYAVSDGVITRVGETGSKSSILVLDLPNTDDTAVYQHAEFIVETGTTVKAGDIIGYMSDIGTPGQVHLHFEIRKDGLYAGTGGTGELVNPLEYLPSSYAVVN